VDAFGSIARSEQKEDSDIDLIIEFSEPRREKKFLPGFLDSFTMLKTDSTRRSIYSPKNLYGIQF